YLADRQLYLRSMGETEARPVTGAEQQGFALFSPAFSPDGRYLAFIDAATLTEATIKKIAITGGAPVTIYKGPVPMGIHWDVSGIVLAQYAPPHRLLRISPNGGAPEVLGQLKDDELSGHAQLLPGGQAILFTTTNLSDSNNWDKARIVVQQLKSGERKTLIDG